MEFQGIIYLVIGLIVGFIIGYTLFRTFVLKQKNVSQESLNELNVEKSIIEDRVKYYEQENQKNSKELDQERESNTLLEKKLSAMESDAKNFSEKLELQKKEMLELNEKFKLEFENVATKILKQNTIDFSSENQKSIGQLVNPLKERIEKFEETISKTYEKGLRDQTDLKVEIKSLHELNKKISEDASNLTNALKSDSKKQGNWGELILEKVLERSGLVKGQEYLIQYTDRTEDGTLIRPDVIVNLPDEKHVIIDSKVSLLAYNEFVNEEDYSKKEKYLKMHVDSIKEHVKSLSDKNYQSARKLDAPDFVLMFLPIESAFSAAMQNDPQLFNLAWDKKIVVVSPTTLLATLKTIEAIWKHEKQTQNAIEIARQGGGLYDKFDSFIRDLEKVGSQISTAHKTYEEAHKKLSTGHGNIISRIEKLKKLGAKASKELPKHLLDEEEN